MSYLDTINGKLTAEEKDLVAQTILEGLEGQRFTDWYETDFFDYIEGCENAPSKEEILKKIKRIFRLDF